jgi:hypothetical protein
VVNCGKVAQVPAVRRVLASEGAGVVYWRIHGIRLARLPPALLDLLKLEEPMLATRKTAKTRTPTPPAPVVSAVPHHAAERPSRIHQPDAWALWFWLGCAGVLILLHVIDWISSALAALLRR